MKHTLNRYIKYLLGALLVVASFPVLAADIPGPDGGAWYVYGVGNAQVLRYAFIGIREMVESTYFETAITLVVLIGFTAIMFSFLTDPLFGFKRLMSYLLLVIVIPYSFKITATVTVKDFVTPVSEQYTGVPALLVIPASIFSIIGQNLAKMVTWYFAPVGSAGNPMLNDRASFGLGAQMILDASEYRYSDPDLNTNLGIYLTDCVAPLIASGQIPQTTLLEAPDIWALINQNKTKTAGLISEYWYPHGGTKKRVIASCPEVANWLEEDMRAEAPWQDFMYHKFGKDYTKFQQYAQDYTQYLFPNRTDITNNYVRQAAMINLMNNYMPANMAAVTGSSALYMKLVNDTNVRSVESGWQASSRMAYATSGYFYSVVQVLIFALAPIVILMMAIPGIGGKMLMSYVQMLAWFPMCLITIALINSIMLHWYGQTIDTMVHPDGHISLSNYRAITAQTTKFMEVSAWLTTLAPLLAWGMITGSSFVLSRVIGNMSSAHGSGDGDRMINNGGGSGPGGAMGGAGGYAGGGNLMAGKYGKDGAIMSDGRVGFSGLKADKSAHPSGMKGSDLASDKARAETAEKYNKSSDAVSMDPATRQFTPNDLSDQRASGIWKNMQSPLDGNSPEAQATREMLHSKAMAGAHADINNDRVAFQAGHMHRNADGSLSPVNDGAGGLHSTGDRFNHSGIQGNVRNDANASNSPDVKGYHREDFNQNERLAMGYAARAEAHGVSDANGMNPAAGAISPQQASFMNQHYQDNHGTAANPQKLVPEYTRDTQQWHDAAQNARYQNAFNGNGMTGEQHGNLANLANQIHQDSNAVAAGLGGVGNMTYKEALSEALNRQGAQAQSFMQQADADGNITRGFASPDIGSGVQRYQDGGGVHSDPGTHTQGLAHNYISNRDYGNNAAVEQQAVRGRLDDTSHRLASDMVALDGRHVQDPNTGAVYHGAENHLLMRNTAMLDQALNGQSVMHTTPTGGEGLREQTVAPMDVQQVGHAVGHIYASQVALQNDISAVQDAARSGNLNDPAIRGMANNLASAANAIEKQQILGHAEHMGQALEGAYGIAHSQQQAEDYTKLHVASAAYQAADPQNSFAEKQALQNAMAGTRLHDDSGTLQAHLRGGFEGLRDGGNLDHNDSRALDQSVRALNQEPLTLDRFAAHQENLGQWQNRADDKEQFLGNARQGVQDINDRLGDRNLGQQEKHDLMQARSALSNDIQALERHNGPYPTDRMQQHLGDAQNLVNQNQGQHAHAIQPQPQNQHNSVGSNQHVGANFGGNNMHAMPQHQQQQQVQAPIQQHNAGIAQQHGGANFGGNNMHAMPQHQQQQQAQAPIQQHNAGIAQQHVGVNFAGGNNLNNNAPAAIVHQPQQQHHAVVANQFAQPNFGGAGQVGNHNINAVPSAAAVQHAPASRSVPSQAASGSSAFYAAGDNYSGVRGRMSAYLNQHARGNNVNDSDLMGEEASIMRTLSATPNQVPDQGLIDRVSAFESRLKTALANGKK